MKRKQTSKDVAKKYLKSGLFGKPCFRKTIYPTEASAEKGATIVWSRDPSANRADLHAYPCPDGCKGWHIGHISYFIMTQKVENVEVNA